MPPRRRHELCRDLKPGSIFSRVFRPVPPYALLGISVRIAIMLRRVEKDGRYVPENFLPCPSDARIVETFIVTIAGAPAVREDIAPWPTAEAQGGEAYDWIVRVAECEECFC